MALHIGDGDRVFGFDFYEGLVETFEREGTYTARVAELFDPVAHRWVRMTFDDRAGQLSWEVSADGLEWSVIDTENELPRDWSFATTKLEIAAGVWEGPASNQTIAVVDNAFVCGS